jgi:hypothetical protein
LQINLGMCVVTECSIAPLLAVGLIVLNSRSFPILRVSR